MYARFSMQWRIRKINLYPKRIQSFITGTDIAEKGPGFEESGKNVTRKPKDNQCIGYNMWTVSFSLIDF